MEKSLVFRKNSMIRDWYVPRIQLNNSSKVVSLAWSNSIICNSQLLIDIVCVYLKINKRVVVKWKMREKIGYKVQHHTSSGVRHNVLLSFIQQYKCDSYAAHFILSCVCGTEYGQSCYLHHSLTKRRLKDFSRMCQVLHLRIQSRNDSVPTLYYRNAIASTLSISPRNLHTLTLWKHMYLSLITKAYSQIHLRQNTF